MSDAKTYTYYGVAGPFDLKKGAWTYDRVVRSDGTEHEVLWPDGAWRPLSNDPALLASGIGGVPDMEEIGKAEADRIAATYVAQAPDPVPTRVEKTVMRLADPVARVLKRSGFAPTVTFTKAETDGDRNLVFGWASVIYKDGASGPILEDRQGHQIGVRDLEDAAYRHVRKYRKTGEMHATGPLGEMVESMVFTPDKIAALGLPPNFPVGWWVGYEVPPATFAKVKSGVYKMFSIQGGAILEPVI